MAKKTEDVGGCFIIVILGLIMILASSEQIDNYIDRWFDLQEAKIECAAMVP